MPRRDPHVDQLSDGHIYSALKKRWTDVSSLTGDTDPRDISRRLAWRCTVMRGLGVALVILGLTTDWRQADPTLPATGAFFTLVGVLLFAATWWRRARS
jgi:hypothetical protein